MHVSLCLYVIIEIGKSESRASLFRLISANNGACEEPDDNNRYPRILSPYGRVHYVTAG